jgi:fructose-1,6-bisphosphatase I
MYRRICAAADAFANATFMTVLQRGSVAQGWLLKKWMILLVLMKRFESVQICGGTGSTDGSSNIDVNISIGTIFGIYRRLTETGSPCSRTDFLQKEKTWWLPDILFTVPTMLVYATRRGVNGFTLDPSRRIHLSHPISVSDRRENLFCQPRKLL